MGSCCCKTGTVVVHPQRKSDASDDPLFADFHSDRGSESDSAGLVNQVGISTHDPSKLINGYENESSVSLEEALKPLQGQIPGLLMQIKDAKSKCHYPSEHHLTRDESAALYLYTMQRNDLDSLYHHLQRAWQSGRRSSLRPWFKYLKLLRSALDKLPNAKTEVWQGMVYDAEWAKTLQSNAVPLYTCMGTCSPSLSHLRDDLQRRSDDKLILIGYESIHGKDITGYSARHEKEVMMWPGIRLKKVEDKDSDSHISLILHFSGKSSKYYELVSQESALIPSLSF